ncbi:DUF4440 domain-containing protein [Serratia ureilytica]|uniref:DUF4440 domain-containing protein n=1 Tax=Serratia ureilytica TaxID=300181 RepID=UPI001C1230E3|nr:DUF4440 domain-containing protein [Serratia ureilytica]MBU5412445.1 DUF4440 domain-containing protein [Serratia ureilytica]
MKKIVIISLVFILNPGFSIASSVSGCVRVVNADVENLFVRWNETLKSGDANKVNGNYLTDAVLLPTLSNKIRVSDSERIDYFNYFLKRKPVGKVNNRKILLGCDSAVDTGDYTFIFSDHSSVSARYTFTYAWDGNDWKISSHHSSKMPEG